jgi:hypothetical protein
MHVELYSYASGKQQLMAMIQGDGTIAAIVPLSPDIRANIEDQKARTPGDAAFLRALTLEFSGTYVRAKLIR